MTSNRFPSVEFGNSKSKDIVVLLAGFPDDTISGWKPLLDRMKTSTVGKDRRYICLCLPGYQNDAPPLPRWGIPFPDLITQLHTTLEELIPGDNKYSLLIHDWGCYVGYVYPHLSWPYFMSFSNQIYFSRSYHIRFLYHTLHPAKIKRIVALDVGFMEEKEQPLYHIVVLCFYQWCLACSFIFSQWFGQTMGQLVFMLSRFVVTSVPYLSPIPWDVLPRPVSELHVSE